LMAMRDVLSVVEFGEPRACDAGGEGDGFVGEVLREGQGDGAPCDVLLEPAFRS